MQVKVPLLNTINCTRVLPLHQGRFGQSICSVDSNGPTLTVAYLSRISYEEPLKSMDLIEEVTYQSALIQWAHCSDIYYTMHPDFGHEVSH